MTTDFRSLCVELVRAIESESKTTILGHTLMCAYIKATDALEQPGAVGDRVAELEAELERERLRLAACGVVAMADTPETAAKARDMHPDCRSASLDDVIRQVDALMALRSKLAQPEQVGVTDEELNDTYWKAWHEHFDRTNSALHAAGLRAVIARYGRPVTQPEPVGPSDEELLCLEDLRDAWNAQADAVNSWDELGMDEIIWFAQQQALARWGRPVTQPEPVGPTDEEILALSQWHEVSYTLSNGSVVYPLQEGSDMKDAVLSFTRAVLQRWGRSVRVQ